MARGEVKLLYVAPERLSTRASCACWKRRAPGSSPSTRRTASRSGGTTSGPSTAQLRQLRELFPQAVIAAFTATATTRVAGRHQARSSAWSGRRSFQGSFNRANLFYEVRPKQGAYEQIVDYIRAHRDESGIIYCQSRAEHRAAGRAAARRRLQRRVAYHAGLDSDERRAGRKSSSATTCRSSSRPSRSAWASTSPTCASSSTTTCRRTWRATTRRAAAPAATASRPSASCSTATATSSSSSASSSEKDSEAERASPPQQLRHDGRLGRHDRCRRRALLAYFDEVYDGSTDPCCDVCRAPVEEADYTVPAQMFLSCVKRTGERFGAAHVIDVLRGSRNQRIQQWRHDQLSTYGIGRERPRRSGSIWRGSCCWAASARKIPSVTTPS